MLSTVFAHILESNPVAVSRSLYFVKELAFFLLLYFTHHPTHYFCSAILGSFLSRMCPYVLCSVTPGTGSHRADRVRHSSSYSLRNSAPTNDLRWQPVGSYNKCPSMSCTHNGTELKQLRYRAGAKDVSPWISLQHCNTTADQYRQWSGINNTHAVNGSPVHMAFLRYLWPRSQSNEAVAISYASHVTATSQTNHQSVLLITRLKTNTGAQNWFHVLTCGPWIRNIKIAKQ